MSHNLPPFPAVLLCRGQGTIFYANAPAIEQGGRLTGGNLSSFGTMGGLLARLFPASRERANAGLARAFRLAKRRGSLRFRILLPEQASGLRKWDVCVTSCPDHAEETFQLSFKPSGAMASLPDPTVDILLSSALHARRVLDKAIEAAQRDGELVSEKSQPLLALIQRARGLLATLEEMPRDAFSSTAPPSGKEG